tara:strand:- start:427 stop:621 length:195 start_codon:yes stop_codon:yes gene_type:complete
LLGIIPTKGNIMHEVKVFDASGNLKKIISIETLNKRTERQINSPYFYNKKGRKVKPLLIQEGLK